MYFSGDILVYYRNPIVSVEDPNYVLGYTNWSKNPIKLEAFLDADYVKTY